MIIRVLIIAALFAGCEFRPPSYEFKQQECKYPQQYITSNNKVINCYYFNKKLSKKEVFLDKKLIAKALYHHKKTFIIEYKVWYKPALKYEKNYYDY